MLRVAYAGRLAPANIDYNPRRPNFAIEEKKNPMLNTTNGAAKWANNKSFPELIGI
jgi:hypothetical protein